MSDMNQHQFQTRARDFKMSATLSDESKRTMLTRIYDATPEPTAIPSAWSFSFVTVHRYTVSALMLLILITSSATYVAASSLPGDPLYALKINVIEPITLAAHWDEVSRNDYKVSLLQKRILELEELKRAGRIEVENIYASYLATELNVEAIEASALFDADGRNPRVSTYIETYNALTDDAFHIKTIINSTPEGLQGSSTASTSVHIEADIPLPQLEQAKDDLVREVLTVVDDITETFDQTEPTVESVTAPTRAITTPLRRDGGL